MVIKSDVSWSSSDDGEIIKCEEAVCLPDQVISDENTWSSTGSEFWKIVTVMLCGRLAAKRVHEFDVQDLSGNHFIRCDTAS